MLSNAIGYFGAIGLIGNTIGFYTGLKDTLFHPAPAVGTNNLRVYVGLTNKDVADEMSLQGSAPALAVWDAGGNFLGQDTPDAGSIIPAGGFRGYAIEGRGGVDYLSVVQTGNDGVCISSITVQSANVGLQFLWTGDIGKACGAPWYPQRNAISVDDPRLVPACVWIDGNGDSGHNWKGFNMHVGSFSILGGTDAFDEVTELWTANRDLLCRSEPRFSLYEDIKVGSQIRTYITDPTRINSASQEYADQVLSSDNWGWGEMPTAGELRSAQPASPG